MAIESELLWLTALVEETPLTVPQPVPNCSGRWVTSLDLNGNLVLCTLLRWVEGNHLESEPTEPQIYQLGQLMAHLHQQASRWSVPAGFSRPSHVEAFFVGATIENFAFHSTNPKEQNWLACAVPYVAQRHLHRWLQDQPFLFEF
jgi:Ser/Thr protein kinase RdoA (MazF antagonist)